jgi:glycosyltransferase involved in cell wall biosynthesis
VVSIIIPTYNRAHLIEASIQSVLQQTYSNFELLIIDDGSEDDTHTIIASIKDDRIKYFKKEHIGHTSVLKNFALNVAKGDLIGFNDSDDIWKQDKLMQQVEIMNANPSVGFCISDVTTFRDDAILIAHSYQLQNVVEYENIFDRLKNGKMLVYNPTLLIRKECFDKVGLFDEQMFSGDYQFNMRLSYYYKAAIIYDTLVLRRAHDSNMSEQMPFENYAEYIETYQYLYKHKMINLFDVCKAKSNAFLKIGKIYSLKGNKQKAMRNYINSIKYGIPVPLHFFRLWRSLMLAKRK